MIRKENVIDIQPLTPMQEGMLFHHLLGDNPTAYHEMLRIRLARADTARLVNAWEKVVLRYDALRRVFVADRTKQPVQMVLREIKPDMASENLSGLLPAERESVLEEKISKLRTRAFILDQKPPFFVRFYSLGELGCEMVFCFHHILLDGWSLGLVLDDLFSFYRGKSASALPKIPDMRQYHNWRSRYDELAAKAYWKSRLQGWDGGTDLPFFTETGSRQPFRPEAMPLRFTPKETADFKALAARLELTLSALVEGVWRVLLYRYTGSRDGVFGRVSAGRPPEVPGIERMAGLFIQTLPVRVQVDGGKPFAGLCRDLLEDAFGAQEHGHLCLAEIQNASGSETLSFSHILVFENFPSPGSAEALETASGLCLRSASFEEHSSYDLEVVVHPEPVLDISFRFNASRMETNTVRRMAGHFDRALRAVLENPFQAAGEIQILDSSEWQAVVPPIPVLFREPMELTARMMDLAGAHPEKPLFFCGNQMLTAGAFLDMARRVAAGLIDLGVRPGDGVGIAMKRSEFLPVAIYGVLFSGAFWVPMDPSHPAERNAYIRENSHCRYVVGDDAASGVRAFSSLLGERRAPFRKWDKDSPAYRIYTSGSTGQPKGVTVSRDNLAVFGENLQPRFGFSPGDCILAHTTVTFDISILEIVVAPAFGMAAVIADDAECRDPEALMDRIRARNVNLVQMTPSFLKLMMDVHDGGRPFPAGLRRILVGGEPLSPSFARRLLSFRQSRSSEGTDFEIVNVYGPTESTIWSTAWTLSEGAVSVGEPLAGEAVYLLSEEGQPAPLGAVGEIAVAGRGVALGYHDLPEKNARKFRKNLFGHGRIYHTGDLGFRRPDGLICCLGRMDDQVKIRGNRIEPGEIAAIFLDHPDVRDAVADAVELSGEKSLCCWILPENGGLPNNLREYGRRRLPEAMLPDFFVAVEAIPLNPGGKADRKQLPPPGGTGDDTEQDLLNFQEIRLADIWREVLGVVPTRRETSFFAMGGHSLKAIQLVSRIRKRLGADISIRDIFSAPTLGEQALLLKAPGLGHRAESFLPAPEDAGCPLSPGQLRMWLVESRGGHPGAYNTAGLFLLEGRPDPGAFEKAMTMMVARHESLRTVYGLTEGRPCQRILEPFAVSIVPETITLPTDPEAEIQTLQAVADAEAHLPFDLCRGPLFRIRWIILAPMEGRERAGLIMTFHHIASDGWSDGILAREINEAYEAFAHNRIPDLPPLPVRYRDYAFTLDRWLSSPEAAYYQEFWRQRLAGVTPVDLPLDFSRPPVRRNRGGRHYMEVASETKTTLEQGAGALGLSLFQLLLGATALFLHHRSGQTDFVVGTPSAGRWHSDLEPLVGFFLNMVPIRICFDEGATGGALLQTAARAAIEALAREKYPFERMVADAGVAEDPSRHPLFDVMLIVHTQDRAAFDLAGCRVRELPLSQPGCRFDLDFEWHTADGDHSFLDYDADLFTPETAARMGADFVSGCLWLLENPETPIANFGPAGDPAFAAEALAPLSEDF